MIGVSRKMLSNSISWKTWATLEITDINDSLSFFSSSFLDTLFFLKVK
jgi:hypothetical protein